MTEIPTQPAVSASAEAEFEAAVRAEIRLLRAYFRKQIKLYRLSRATVVLSAALVPILASAPAVPRWVLAALGAVAAVTEALVQLFGFRQSSLDAMRTANALERQLTRYMASIEPYGREVNDAFGLFALKIEEIREGADAAFHRIWEEATGVVKKSSEK